MNKEELNNQTKYTKARLSFLIGTVVTFVLIMSLLVWREYSLTKNKMIGGNVGFTLKRVEFEKLWSKLLERTRPVEVSSKIRYGEDIGKLEPFE